MLAACVVAAFAAGAAGPAPVLRAERVAPTEIRLAIDVSGFVTSLTVDGGPEGEPARTWYAMTTGGRPRREGDVTHGLVVVAARPGTTYRFRGGAVLSRTGERTPDSAECVVRTPPAPDDPPAVPIAVAAEALSPFTVEIRWAYAGPVPYGFEIQRREGAGDFGPLGVAEPDARRFVDHGRRPATGYTYRVRAFNPRGVSAASREAAATTRGMDAITPSEAADPPGPCTTLAAATRPTDEREEDAGIRGMTAVCRGVALGGERRADAVTAPYGCGAQNCTWALFADADGCYRRIGQITLTSGCPRVETLAIDRAGWPVIRGYAHLSAIDSWVTVQAFVRGRYVMVDSYTTCASGVPAVRTSDEPLADDPTKWSPPFAECQER